MGERTAERMDSGATAGTGPNAGSDVDGGQAIRGEVFAFELTGDATLVTLQIGPARFTAKAGKDFQARIGEVLTLHAPADRCHLFDAASQRRLERGE